MRAGKLRRRLQIERRVSTTDAEGSPQEGPTIIGGCWARIQPLTATERLVAAQAGVQVTHLVTTRYRPDLVTSTAHDLWFVEGNRQLEIISQPIDLDERHRELQIECRELLPG